MAGGFGIESGSGKEYPGKLTWFVLVACVLSAMGGLIFGYDLGISGGVTSMTPFLQEFFPSVYRLEEENHSTNQYCKFDSPTLTLFTSSLYLAALVASLIASYVTNRMGRKLSMLLGGLIFLLGATINAAAVNVAMLIIGRILLGFGVGFSIQSVPLYVSEMAPYKYRGSLNVLFNVSITVGILVANIVNYFTARIKGGWGWRISLGGAGVPAIFIAFSAFILPDTPNSMIVRGKPDKALGMLRKIGGVEDVQAEFDDLSAASEDSKKVAHPWKNIKMRKHRPHLTISILILCFKQLTGVNVVTLHAQVLFKSLGFGSDVSLFSAVIIGAVNVLAALMSIYGTDKWGRRSLFLEGGLQMLICQIAVAVLIALKFGVSGEVTFLPKWYGGLVVLCLCLYQAAFAWSWGPLAWLVPSEIFPLEIRSAAQSITASVNMLFTFGVAEVFLTMLCHLKYGLFILFAAFVLIMTLFVYFFLPETKNIPIENMNHIWKEHWYWKRFITTED
ncbi:Major facilitator, sugar transporter-like [Dillenia turbinata]|uniref:Major facilitator, sugar transporter-like n=1 Tax=Dillenia turbinata TaxID=194707 RepID=A0AAN8V5L7_9MAGN